MKIPSPRDLNFPEKFERWRPVQEAIIERILHDNKRVTAICAGTGTGKSAAYMAAAIISKKPTCIVTDSRGLQDQLTGDFGQVGLVDLRGRGNYECGFREDYSCDEGYAAMCPYKGTAMCLSSQAEIRAALSNLVVTNYAKWTSAKKFGTGMAHFQQVIFDEGHAAPGALESAMQVTLHSKEIEEGLKLDFPSGTDAEYFSNWGDWFNDARLLAEEAARVAHDRIVNSPSVKAAWVRHFNHMRNLARNLATLTLARPQDWVVDETEDGFQFDPIRAGRYAEAALLMRMPRVIITSATLRPKTMFMLGLPMHEFSFIEYDSEFDPARCPVYWIPTIAVSHRVDDLSPLWNRLDQIASRRRDRKGIIHTVSYARRDDIVKRSRFAGNMIINPKGEPSTQTVADFKASGPGTILVSPSVGTGYDFPMDSAEWQFICKVPFPDGRSKILKARKEEDPEYGYYLAMQKLVQALGRIMRSKEDRGESFLADDNIGWFRKNYSHLAPRSFHMFFRRVEIVPPPPERLIK